MQVLKNQYKSKSCSNTVVCYVNVVANIYMNIAGNRLILSFDYNPHIKDKIKKIPGTYFNPELTRWEAPLNLYEKLAANLDNLSISKGVLQWLTDEAKLRKKVEELQKKDYYELTDYTPKVPLMSHQKRAFELHRICNGSANFGEMGCGKTASAICAIHWWIETGKTKNALVVCPKSVIKGWEEQINFFSDLSYVALEGTMDERIKKLSLPKDIYLINYEAVWRMEEQLKQKGFNAMVCDEAHRIKNSTSKQSKACYVLGDLIEHKIALTGSPILNSPIDAFGIMRFTDPTVFGENFYAFRNKYFLNVSPEHSPIQLYVPRHNAEKEISDKMYTRAMRVLKEECLELPEAVFAPNRLIPLSAEQDKAYRKLQEELSAEIAENKEIKITHVLTLMLKLNQITSGWIKDPATGEIIHFKSNPKLEELISIVEDEAGDQPIIIWAYYVADMQLITQYFGRCTKCKSPVNNIANSTCKCGAPIRFRCSEIQGSTKYRYAEIAKFRYTPAERAEQRKKLIADGKSKTEIRNELGDLLADGSEPPQTNIIVVQCVAGSEGLNLQRATLAIFFSRNWSLKDWTQALARNHRSGQTKSVTYINLVATMIDGSNTVDQRIVDALQKKEDLSKRMNKDDLKLLTGGFKKKDKEALKDVTLVDDGTEFIDAEATTITATTSTELETPETTQQLLF